MLSTMRKHATSWIIKFMIGAIAIVFVFWGVGSFNESKQNQVGQVNEDGITSAEYRQVYEQLIERLKQQFGRNLNEEIIKMLNVRQQAMNQVVEVKLLLQEAKKLEFRVTDAELAAAIADISYFKTNGQFDSRLYNNLLSRNRLSPEQFEKIQRESMLTDRVRGIISAGVKVSEQEAREWYNWQNSQVDMEFVTFKPELQKNITASGSEIEDFFEKNKKDYETEPKIKVRYLHFDPSNYKAQIKMADEEVKAYYASNPESFKTPETVEARHILLKVNEGASDALAAQKRDEAEKIAKQAREGADFASLAKKHSEGPTKDKGGYLGAFERKNMVKPFANAAFELKAGEISDPVRTEFGWHVIKVEKKNPASSKTFAEVESQIRTKLTDEEAGNLAYDDVEAVFDVAFQGDDLVQAAEAHGMALRTTEFFTQSAPAKDLPNPAKFVEAAFKLAEMEISEILDFGDGYYLLQVTKSTPAQIPPLTSVESQVRKDLIEKKKDDATKAVAKTFLEKVKNGQPWSELAKKGGLETIKTGWFKRSAEVPKIGYEQAIADAAFNLSAANKFPEDVLMGPKGYYVLAFKGRKGPEADGFGAEKAGIVERLRQQKQQVTLQSWLESAKEKSVISVVPGFLD
jgi:peptidyl-prolyl cis-trans isomerase D